MADDTNNRLEAMADELHMTLAALLELAERHGLEIVATQPRKPAKRMEHC